MKKNFEIYDQIINQLSNDEINELIIKLQKHLHKDFIYRKINDQNKNINTDLNTRFNIKDEEGTLNDIRYKK